MFLISSIPFVCPLTIPVAISCNGMQVVYFSNSSDNLIAPQWCGIIFTMKLYDNEDIGMCNVHTCCSLKDIEDARAVATTLGMPYYVMNFQDGFNEKIIEPFSRTYLHGATPNPCIDCNRYSLTGSGNACLVGCSSKIWRAVRNCQYE